MAGISVDRTAGGHEHQTGRRVALQFFDECESRGKIQTGLKCGGAAGKAGVVAEARWTMASIRGSRLRRSGMFSMPPGWTDMPSGMSERLLRMIACTSLPRSRRRTAKARPMKPAPLNNSIRELLFMCCTRAIRDRC